MNRIFRAFFLSVSALLLLCVGSGQAAPDRHPEELFPDTVAVYLQVPHTKGTLDCLLDHPLTQRILSMEAVQHALEDKKAKELQAVVRLVETQLDLTWRQALAKVSGGGLYLGVDVKTEGVALLVKADDAETRHRVLESVMTLARADAIAKGKDDAYLKHDYRGVTAYQVGQGFFAEIGPWLLVTNKPELGKYVANAYLDGNQHGLATAAWYQPARGGIQGTPAAWAAFDLPTLHAAGVAKDLFRERTENIVAEVILGGVHETMRNTPLATAAIYVENDQVRMRLTTPFEESWISEARQYYFAGAAPARPQLPQQILAVSTFRDLAHVWLHAPDLFEVRAIDETAKAESGLSNLFGGRDFGEEILGALHPDIQLVVSRQDFGERTPQPAIKLPSFAIVTKLRDAETMRPELRRAFQSIIGFLNVVGATQGQPQLDLDMEKTTDFEMVTSGYLPNEDNQESHAAEINYNFSPSVAFAGDRFVLASSAELARKLTTAPLTASTSTATSAGDATTNTTAHLDIGQLQQILADNREQLIGQNMLEKGNERAAAEAEVDTLLSLLRLLREGTFRLQVSPSELELLLEVRLATL